MEIVISVAPSTVATVAIVPVVSLTTISPVFKSAIEVKVAVESFNLLAAAGPVLVPEILELLGTGSWIVSLGITTAATEGCNFGMPFYLLFL